MTLSVIGHMSVLVTCRVRISPLASPLKPAHFERCGPGAGEGSVPQWTLRIVQPLSLDVRLCSS
jgi:hypothetical protein